VLLAADLVISTGGTYLVEAYDPRPRLFELELAARLDKPIVLYTQSIGAFERSRFRRRLANGLNRAALVLLRDQRSLDNVVRLGVARERCFVHSDVAFALTDWERLTKAAKRVLPGRGARVAISVRRWGHFSDGDGAAGMARYERAVARAISWLVLEGEARVEMVSTCQGAAAYELDDALTARRIVDSLPEGVRRHVTVDGSFHTPGELMNMLESVDFVIATRMHMAILALAAGVPVLPIAYEFKTEEMFSALGCGNWVSRIDDVTPESLEAKLRTFLDEVDGVRPALFAGVERMRDSARRSMERVRHTLQERQVNASNARS
jgi:colanic acid/amylovoran biosynthesis protein